MIDDCILTLLLGCRSSGSSQFSRGSIPYVVEGGVRVSLLSDFSSVGYPESYPGTDPGAQKEENSVLQAQAASLSLRTFGRSLSERLRWPWNRTDGLSIERPDIIIIICLSYPGEIGCDGKSAQNEESKSNLQMLLYHLDYRHSTDYSRFRIIIDFDCVFRDSGGLCALVPRIPATRQSIKSAIKATLTCLEKDEKCLIYYFGDTSRACACGSCPEPTPQLGNYYLVVNKVERIGNWEFRGWLSRSRFPSSTIVVVLDAPWSGGFLDLQYSYELLNGDWKAVKRSVGGDHPESLVVEISASRYGENSWNQLIKCGNGVEIWCGVLTLYLIRYLRGNELPNIKDLASYLYTECNSCAMCGEEQTTLISSSKKLEGQVALF